MVSISAYRYVITNDVKDCYYVRCATKKIVRVRKMHWLQNRPNTSLYIVKTSNCAIKELVVRRTFDKKKHAHHGKIGSNI